MKIYTIKHHNFPVLCSHRKMVNLHIISVNAWLAACGFYLCCICWSCDSIYSSRSCRCTRWTFFSIPFVTDKSHIFMSRQHHDRSISRWNISLSSLWTRKDSVMSTFLTPVQYHLTIDQLHHYGHTVVFRRAMTRVNLWLVQITL